MSGRPSRILLIQLRWMGDVLLTTPAIRLLRQQLPDARIDLLTDATGATVVQGNPHLDECIIWRRGARADLALFRTLRAAHYDAVVDFRAEHWRTAVQSFITRAPIRVGLRSSPARDRMYTAVLERDVELRYAALQKISMLAPLGIDIPSSPDLRLDIAVTDAERAWAAQFYAREGVSPHDRVVAVTPTSRYHYKQWSRERWSGVIDSLADNGARVVVTNGPGEEEQAREVAEGANADVIRAGGTTLRQLIALLDRSEFWVGNDGGAKHIAAALGKSTVSVDRYRNAMVWTEPSPLHTAVEAVPVLHCDFICSQCSHISCLEQIDVSAVTAPALVRLSNR